MVESQPGDGLLVGLDPVVLRRLRTHAAAVGMSAATLAGQWLTQRLEVEDATRRARGGGAEHLLRLVQAIEDVELPDPDR